MQCEIHDCESVVEVLAGYDEVGVPPGPVRRHLGACLRCQAELSGFRRLRRSMGDLSASPIAVDPSLRHEILFALDRVDDRPGLRLTRATAVAIGGLAAAAGVIVVASRQIRSVRVAG